MKPHEELCKESFYYHLVNKLGFDSEQVDWKSWGRPRPDYYLTLKGQKFAVEVTSVFAEVDIGSKKVYRRDYTSLRRRIAKEIEEAAIQEGILRGNYEIIFFGPLGERPKRDLAKIKTKALDYIRRTENQSDAVGDIILGERERYCEIRKAGIDRNVVIQGSFHQDFWKWEGQPLAEVCELLQKAIFRKRRLLLHEPSPKILLLLHHYDFGKPEIYRQCGEIRSIDFFHSIFIVDSKEEGYFLHSQEKSWLAPC